MVRILIVDDEPLARRRLRRFLDQRGEPFAVKEAESGPRALEEIATFRPNLVFLDIAMPGMSGFEVLYQVERRDFVVVFQTAFDEFAVKAFEENACDYLLKPFDEKRFGRALDKALASTPDASALGALETAALRAARTLSRIAVRHRLGLKVLPLADIDYFISRDHYTHVGTKANEYVCNPSIAHLAERLPPEQFRQIHRHCIVRLDAIATIQSGEAMSLQLSTGLSLPVARNRRKDLLRCVEARFGGRETR